MTQKGPLRYSKTCVKLPLSKRPKIGFQDQLKINAGEKYCRMLKEEQGQHSAILCTVIEIPFVIKIFVVPRLFEEKQGDIVHIVTTSVTQPINLSGCKAAFYWVRQGCVQ